MNISLQPGMLSSAPEPHLDADQLSAFLEGALPEPERGAALRHMAACADCRDHVFLAQTAEAAETPSVLPQAIEAPAAGPFVPVKEPAPSLLQSLAQLWGRRQVWAGLSFDAAACCLVAVLLLQHRPHASPANEPGPAVVAKLSQQNQPPAPSPLGSPTPPRPAPNVPPAFMRQRQATPPAPLGDRSAATAGLLPPQAEAPPPPARKVSPQPSAVENLPLKSRSYGPAMSAPPPRPAPSGNAASQNLQGYVTRPPVSPKAEPQASAAGSVAQPAPAAPPAPVAPMAAAPPAPAKPGGVTVPAANETVEVSADSAAVATVSNQSLALLPQPAALPSKLAPVASAVSGSTLLELDSAGTLFRSTNTGKHWKRVKSAWHGAIQSLELTPDSRFQITTTERTVWLSKDGAHWTQIPATPH